MGTCVFSKAHFHKKAVFHYTQVSKNMILRESWFERGLNLAPINFINDGYINIFDLRVDDFNHDETAKDIDYGRNWQCISSSHKRETYRILKHESIKSNNKISALDYHIGEMNARKADLKDEPWSNIDKCLLKVNEVSNLYGTDWLRGFVFTLVVSIPFYLLYVSVLPGEPFKWEWDGFGSWGRAIANTINYYPEFLYPAHSFDFISESYNGWAVIVDILGRIAIGFGIYQTIQAFRKYGKP